MAIPVNSIAEIFPVRKPHKVVFQDPANTPSLTEDPMELEIILETQQGSEWIKRAEFINPFSRITDTASVNIEKALTGTMQQIPFDVFSNGIKPLEKITNKYRLKSRTILDGIPIDPYDITAEKTAWLAGSSYLDGNPNITGLAYKFLTTRPLSRKYHPQEKMIACFLPLFSGTATLQVTYTPTTGTPETLNFAIGAVTAYQPFAYVWDTPEQFKLNATATVELTGLTGNPEILTLYSVKQPTMNFRQLIYANSLGGFDTLIMSGTAQEGFESISETMEGQLFAPTTGQEGNFSEYNATTKLKLILRSGYLSLSDILATRDMFTLKKIYLLKNFKLIKILPTNGFFSTGTDNNGINFLEMEVSAAFTDQAISRP